MWCVIPFAGQQTQGTSEETLDSYFLILCICFFFFPYSFLGCIGWSETETTPRTVLYSWVRGCRQVQVCSYPVPQQLFFFFFFSLALLPPVVSSSPWVSPLEFVLRWLSRVEISPVVLSSNRTIGYAGQAGNIVFLSAGIKDRPQYMCAQTCRQAVGRVVLKQVGGDKDMKC